MNIEALGNLGFFVTSISYLMSFSKYLVLYHPYNQMVAKSSCAKLTFVSFAQDDFA